MILVISYEDMSRSRLRRTFGRGFPLQNWGELILKSIVRLPDGNSGGQPGTFTVKPVNYRPGYAEGINCILHVMLTVYLVDTTSMVLHDTNNIPPLHLALFR